MRESDRLEHISKIAANMAENLFELLVSMNKGENNIQTVNELIYQAGFIEGLTYNGDKKDQKTFAEWSAEHGYTHGENHD